jgi:hypothetical protein
MSPLPGLRNAFGCPFSHGLRRGPHDAARHAGFQARGAYSSAQAPCPSPPRGRGWTFPKPLTILELLSPRAGGGADVPFYGMPAVPRVGLMKAAYIATNSVATYALPDELVYQLYGITEDARKMIEGLSEKGCSMTTDATWPRDKVGACQICGWRAAILGSVVWPRAKQDFRLCSRRPGTIRLRFQFLKETCNG